MVKRRVLVVFATSSRFGIVYVFEYVTVKKDGYFMSPDRFQ